MTPRPNEIYRHFKGNLYKIITIAVHSETGEKMVVYQALYGDFLVYCRPLSMFMEKVDGQKYPEANQEYRFEKVEAVLDGLSLHSVTATAQDISGENTVSDEAEEDLDVEDEFSVDPLVMEFLEADSIAERKNILAALHHRITEDMIYTLALALDIVIDEGDNLEDRYRQLMNCLNTIEKYEIER